MTEAATPLALAARAIEAAAGDPRRARTLAETALAAARRARDPEALSMAHRAAGLAARASYDAGAAARHLRKAVTVAAAHDRATEAAEARMSLALVLDEMGRPAAAVREIDAALVGLRGLRRARAVMQRAVILNRLGRDGEALAGYGAALRVFRRAGDRLWQARALNNRGILHGYHGNLRLAQADLDAAAAIYAGMDLPVGAAQVQHNRGFVAAQAGDVPEALVRYARARPELSRTGPDAVGLLDLAEVLQSVRLLPEAQRAAQDAVDACTAGRLDGVRGEAALLVARIALARGRASEARATAQAARRAFAKHGRQLLVLRALAVELSAQIAAGSAHRGTLRRLQATATALTRAGWLIPAWEAWLDAVHLAVLLQDRPAAAAGLAGAAGAATRGPAALRARLWHQRALVALSTGDVPAAIRAADAGLAEFEVHRSSLGATELRVRSGATIAELAEFRLALAVAHETPQRLLATAQRTCAATLWLPPARPSADQVITRGLAMLRRVHADLSAAPISAAHSGRLMRWQHDLEARIRTRAWQAQGTGPAESGRLALDDLAAALGPAALVDFVAVAGVLHALVVTDGRVVHRPLGPLAPLVEELGGLRFAQRRLVMVRGHAGAAAAAARHAARALDAALLAPLADLTGDRDLVLAPVAQLHAVPWALLPSCRGRPVRVAPSAAMWWRAHRTAQPTGPAVLVGPSDPPHAGLEVARIAEFAPDARVLTGHRARAADVLSALDGARIGHIACHGDFRSDNALFSALRLSDGPLTIYDLSALRTAPGLLVLSGCDTGVSAVHLGEELLGLTSALLQLGTRTVLASTGPVDDEATAALMADVHKRLAAGYTPAAALAAAQLSADQAHHHSTGVFACFGA
ncbi:CHAT domain-containing protein [Dactylosporangium vinaceum]|uniref:CHAT domain-containing protein n=1 Tax=Dactylosporangium vinaceum TaxID=53362 RepID=A0ABV5LZJ5_9ACTN|nr:CHAT domain-containing protein [Dactylosporangium vinaceum]UAB92554.1 CHAT domain-containing protein [Dactylosporangium vinaceum]